MVTVTVTCLYLRPTNQGSPSHQAWDYGTRDGSQMAPSTGPMGQHAGRNFTQLVLTHAASKSDAERLVRKLRSRRM